MMVGMLASLSLPLLLALQLAAAAEPAPLTAPPVVLVATQKYNSSGGQTVVLVYASVGRECEGLCTLHASAEPCGNSTGGGGRGSSSAVLLPQNSLALGTGLEAGARLDVRVACQQGCQAQPQQFVAWAGHGCAAAGRQAPASGGGVWVLHGGEPAIRVAASEPAAAADLESAAEAVLEEGPPTQQPPPCRRHRGLKLLARAVLLGSWLLGAALVAAS